jgi:hypothetical protein
MDVHIDQAGDSQRGHDPSFRHKKSASGARPLTLVASRFGWGKNAGCCQSSAYRVRRVACCRDFGKFGAACAVARARKATLTGAIIVVI